MDKQGNESRRPGRRILHRSPLLKGREVRQYIAGLIAQEEQKRGK